MEIKVYKTFEIDELLWNKIINGFNESFNGAQTTKNELITTYKSNTFGYSLHAVCTDGKKIVGFNTIYPCYYYHNDDKILLGFSGSTFIMKEYRNDLSILRNIFNVLKEYCGQLNYAAFIGIPNTKSYLYFIKILKFKEINTLKYYVLPLNISKILKKDSLSILNIFSYSFSFIALVINTLISKIWNYKEKKVAYQIYNNKEFSDYRFISTRYKKIESGNKKAWYRVVNEDSINTVYLMDFNENGIKTLRALCFSVWKILKNEQADIIMYVGTMNLHQSLLIKVPEKFTPKRLPFVFYILKKENQVIFNDINKLGNWNFSLLNFDAK